MLRKYLTVVPWFLWGFEAVKFWQVDLSEEIRRPTRCPMDMLIFEFYTGRKARKDASNWVNSDWFLIGRWKFRAEKRNGDFSHTNAVVIIHNCYVLVYLFLLIVIHPFIMICCIHMVPFFCWSSPNKTDVQEKGIFQVKFFPMISNIQQKYSVNPSKKMVLVVSKFLIDFATLKDWHNFLQFTLIRNEE